MSAAMPFQNGRQRGFSLVELMIALTIGLIISLALATMFSQVSVTNKEQFKAALQIENGRYAIDLISNDLKHAGFYGEYAQLPSAPGSMPDPCVIPVQGNDPAAISSLAFYVQGYPASSLTTQASVPAGCQGWIDTNTLKPGSDILVVRRLDTYPVLSGGTFDLGAVFVQASDSDLSIQYGSGQAFDFAKNAKGQPTGSLTRRNYDSCTPSAASPACPLVAAYIRKLHVDIYFVSNCRKGSNDGKCTSSDDTIPTLKRLELSVDSDHAPTFTMVPLAEGIEFLKVYYGVDTNSDGQVDSGGLPQPTSLAQWQNVVQAEIRLLAVNAESSSSFADTNRYDLGRDASGTALTYTPSGNSAKLRRHAFDQQVYIVNVAGRLEK